VVAALLAAAAYYFTIRGSSGGTGGEAEMGRYAFQQVGDMFEAMGCGVKDGNVKCPAKITAPGPDGRPLGKKFALADGAQAVILHATRRIEEQMSEMPDDPPSPPRPRRRRGGASVSGGHQGPHKGPPPQPPRIDPAQGPSAPRPSAPGPSDMPEAGSFSMADLLEYGDYNEEEEMAKYSQAPKGK
jgi:hypothetical protein